MVDIFGYMVQGLFTGLGVGVSVWVMEKYLRKKLDRWHDEVKTYSGKVDAMVSVFEKKFPKKENGSQKDGE